MIQFKTWDNVPYNFSQDLQIAIAFGEKALEDTYNNAIKLHKKEYKVIGRLMYDLNMLCWYYYENGNEKFSEMCSNYYYKCYDFWWDNFGNNEKARQFYMENLD